jgi:hypothetical protein
VLLFFAPSNRFIISFRVLENPFDVVSDTADRQTALLSTSGHSSGNSSGSDDWIEPAAYVLNSTALLSREHRNVLDAFRLLQKDPTVQVYTEPILFIYFA